MEGMFTGVNRIVLSESLDSTWCGYIYARGMYSNST